MLPWGRCDVDFRECLKRVLAHGLALRTHSTRIRGGERTRRAIIYWMQPASAAPAASIPAGIPAGPAEKLQAMHDANIVYRVEYVVEKGYRVALGLGSLDDRIDCPSFLQSTAAVTDWLDEQILRHYPDSDYAKRLRAERVPTLLDP